MIKFPKNFLWGSAISAHQVEGGNIYNDWWEDELKGVFKFSSGDACKHYQFYKQDFDLAKQLNQNALRISIEWSRVEPRNGEFSEEAIGHYIDVVHALKERGIEPVITLHHFTNPVWFNKIGGWLNNDAGDYFTRFTKTVSELLCRDVKYWVTINEPMIYLYFGYFLGCWPPHKKGFFHSRAAEKSLLKSHIQAYQAIHAIYNDEHLSSPLVSIAQNLRYFSVCKDDWKTRLAAYLRDKTYNLSFLRSLHKAKALDYVGVNYYTRENVFVSWPWISNIIFQTCKDEHKDVPKNSLFWDIAPEGFYKVLMEMKEFGLPVFILENGICTNDDNQRREFIEAHLRCLHKAMDEGVNVLGYLYWSLLDNFEWDKGFTPRFGLIDIDYNTYKRAIRESAINYAQVCKNGYLE